MKFLSWNVEHFTGTAAGARKNRINRVVELVRAEDPDVFGLMEVEGSDVFGALVSKMPGYTFAITEGTQIQEILIGVRGGLTAFMTQRNEFKRSNPNLRPGALLSVTNAGGKTLPVLFAHLKSLPSPEGFGLRDAMFEKVRHLKKQIDKAMGDDSRMILVGDLNTMGMNLSYSKNDLSGDDEIARIEKVLARAGFANQKRTSEATFNNGSKSSYPPAALDHVFAAGDLKFADQGQGAAVRVGGWALEPTTPKQDAWIRKFSDHAPLVFEVTNF